MSEMPHAVPGGVQSIPKRIVSGPSCGGTVGGMGAVLLVRQPAQSEPVELDGVEAVYGVGTGTQSRLWAAGGDCGGGRVAVLDANGCFHGARTGVDSGASRCCRGFWFE